MESKKNQNQNEKIENMELIISKTLRAGVLISALIILIGLIIFFATNNSGYPANSYPTSIAAVLKGLLSLKPYSIIMTGLLVLILTPVFRVGVSIITFFQEKDYMYVYITSAVFIILIFSFLLGKVG
ncbi:DUF1634 domain-containing protein [Thermoanaerobacterium thermosaccharolyticum]|jgi:uncharacterized membrane protein|uniref:Membrane protein n=2 Tax=Thermoanaerobacterium thermosaccharolyticum TaxID=1517 RepID=A0A231VGJ3_THETR|nr:DUF1634 domain-containing protein [Thermoanaerobacterium thermosaccharolyticum]AST57523.1 membrane protein [Thermoanaerobacterium thermosaccharolyticum]OXT07297.1 hypothetical protein CE561_07970 [Thermoanaerobacterium thermosaccharolyticum]PHO06159.1 hypothetical protein BFT35_12700 [Thermoanaerobacterium thermosaccharolyticum]TCW32592.1 putative membrane protein [Thermohydrogenium kirishiense]